MTDLEQLITAYGYEPIESKNQYMRSYANEEKRINYYFTTGTIQIQSLEDRKKFVVLKNVDEETLENHL